MPWPTAAEITRYRITAVNPVGSSAAATTVATVAPFSSLGAFVDRQHLDFEGRSPTASQRAAAISALDAGTTSPTAYIDARRASTWFDGAYGPATRLYRAYFLRLPDPSGLDYWAGRRRAGVTLDKISQQFAVSSEFQRRYGPLSNAEFVDTLYQNVFGRDPDPSGRAFYLGRLAAGWSRGRVVLQFSESSEYKRKTEGIVAVVELARGMEGRAPSQARVDELLALHSTGGTKGVVKALTTTSSYRAGAA
jgi:hypothetical protein